MTAGRHGFPRITEHLDAIRASGPHQDSPEHRAKVAWHAQDTGIRTTHNTLSHGPQTEVRAEKPTRAVEIGHVDESDRITAARDKMRRWIGLADPGNASAYNHLVEDLKVATQECVVDLRVGVDSAIACGMEAMVKRDDDAHV